MPKIIVLTGVPDTGKSTTINLLYHLLKKPNSGFTLKKDRVIPNSRDFFAIFEKQGELIGITSYGDSVNILKEKFDFFKNEGCITIVCAGRESGSIYDFIAQYSGLKKRDISKTVVEDKAHETTANNNDAKKILNLLQ